MADSRRHRIVSAIVDRMKLINGSGSYTTDVDDRVQDSESTFAQDQETLPAISVFDGDAVSTPTSTGRTLGTIHEMSVMIVGFTTRGSTALNARTMIKDIMTAIRQDDKWTVSNVQLAMQTRQVADRIMRNTDTHEIEGCQVEIAVQFQTNKFNAE